MLAREADGVEVRRLGPHDRDTARATFALMANVFGESHARLADAYVDALLSRPDFWAVAAIEPGGAPAGGLTAHTLPMTTHESAELFLYDIAVATQHQRRGLGRRLIETLRREASALGIRVVFVPADDEDVGALDFYRALGGAPTHVTMFEFSTTTTGRP